MINTDCHIHMALAGNEDFRLSTARHKNGPDKKYIRSVLQKYSDAGIKYLRDGGDKYGAGLYAADIAEEYGITYLSPYFPIYKNGCYGSFIGRGFGSEQELIRLIKELKEKKAGFVKIMASGIVDFDNYGEMLMDAPDAESVKLMVHIAHEEGFKVMAHASGERFLEAAIEAEADSIEHGIFINRDCLIEMSERGTIWVPTLSAIGNLTESGRYPQDVIKKLLVNHIADVAKGAEMGVKIACGSDAGCFGVEHVKGAADEYNYLKMALGDNIEKIVSEGNDGIFKNFV